MKRAMPKCIFMATWRSFENLQKTKVDISKNRRSRKYKILSITICWLYKCNQSGRNAFQVWNSILKELTTYISVCSLGITCGWGLLDTVKEASGPETVMKRMLSTIARARDGEWYAWLLNRPVNSISSLVTSMEKATMHKRIQSSFSIKYFNRLPRMKKQYWSVDPQNRSSTIRAGEERQNNFTWFLFLSIFS